MADFKTLNGYNVKDEQARNDIELLKTTGTVHFVAPVGNADFGDCAVIQAKDKNIIIDLGNDDTGLTLINFLKGKSINTINYIVISHYHDDHIGGANASGLNALLNDSYFDFSDCTMILPHHNIDLSSVTPAGTLDWTITIETLLLNMCISYGISYLQPTIDGYTINLGNEQNLKFYNLESADFSSYYSYTLSYNTTETNKTNYNNFSMVTIFENGNSNALFTGDIEYPAESVVAPFLKNIDLMKIEHHGVNTFTDNNYIDKLAPKYIVVCNREFYNDSFDYERDTVTNLLLKGALCYDTRSFSNSSFSFKLTKDDVVAVDSASSSTWNPALDLLAGEHLLAGTDLNDITEPGTYYSSSTARTQTLINDPRNLNGDHLIGSGFKMIVMRQYNSGGGDWVLQWIIQLNANTVKNFYRNTIEGSFTGSEWVCLQPSMLQTISPSEFTNYFTTYLDCDVSGSSLIKRNEHVTLGINYKANETVAANADMLSITNTILQPYRSYYFLLFDITTGDVYPVYATFTSTDFVLKNRGKAIPTGTTVRGTLEIPIGYSSY